MENHLVLTEDTYEDLVCIPEPGKVLHVSCYWRGFGKNHFTFSWMFHCPGQIIIPTLQNLMWIAEFHVKLFPHFSLDDKTSSLHCFWFLWFQIVILKGLKQEVTCLCPSPDGLHLAVGYEDGSIRIFSLLSGEGNVTFNGHKAAITSLKYDQLGGRLASGSKVRP